MSLPLRKVKKKDMDSYLLLRSNLPVIEKQQKWWKSGLVLPVDSSTTLASSLTTKFTPSSKGTCTKHTPWAISNLSHCINTTIRTKSLRSPRLLSNSQHLFKPKDSK